MAIAGIDLSLTSPALCVFNGSEEYSIQHCTFHYMADNAKRLINNDQFRGVMYPTYNSQVERYENISMWLIKCLMEYRIEKVFIEDYSYGSTGRVFHIAENTGILKYLLFKYHYQYETIPPTVIKKIATGKGNANKELMQTAFIQENNLDIKSLFSLSEKQWNPSSDIIDSYYVCKYGALGYEKEQP
jgi:Holliday junction resolvasome RuvABC endonuclease subunit